MNILVHTSEEMKGGDMSHGFLAEGVCKIIQGAC